MKVTKKQLVIVLCAVLALALVAGVVFVLTAGRREKDPAQAAEKDYRAAIALLQEGRFGEAADAFTALEHYGDASRYAMYCEALTSAESGDYSQAASTMQALGGFMDSSILSVYYAGRSFEDKEQYEPALERYSAVLQYGDAGARAKEIPGKILERDYRAAYALEAAGRYASALSAFQALNGYSDSAAHITAVRAAMKAQEDAAAYAEAAALEAADRLEDAAAAFRALGAYSDSAARAAALEDRIAESAYQAALQFEQNDDPVSAYRVFTGLGEYRDAAERAAALREEAAYRSAFTAANEGRYAEARTAYEALGEYKDAAEKARLLGVLGLAEESTRLNSGIIGFRLQGLWGFVDLNTNRDVAPAYASIGSFSSVTDLAVVSGNDVYGLIDRRGAVVADNGYLGIREGQYGFYTAVKNGSGGAYRFILLSPEGRELSAWQALGDSANSNPGGRNNSYRLSGPAFTNGVMIATAADGTVSLLNTKGEAVISGAAGITLIRRLAENDTALVSLSRKRYQLTALDGTPLDEHTWASVGDFRSGYAAVCDAKGRWGYIRREDCQVAIEPRYQAAGDFSEGRAAVMVDGLWGYIDEKDDLVIPAVYGKAAAFSSGCAAVYNTGTGWQVIDPAGKLLYFRQTAYMAADAVDQAGEYERAVALFEGLEGYADSADRALQSREKINASVYANAEKLEAEGRYIDAAETFEWLGEYSDAPARAAAARETQNANTYAAAADYEARGLLEDAIAVYLTLGEYKGSAQHAADLRESINRGICGQADALEAEEKYEAAIETLRQIPDYTGVAEHIASLEEKIRLRDYNAAAALEDAGKYEEAIEAFRAMGNYSDAADRITAIRDKIKERDYNAAAALEDDGDYAAAHAAFIALGAYRDSADRAAAVTEKAAEQQRRQAYDAAAAAEDRGELETAAAGFEALGDYSDAQTRLAGVRDKIRQRDYAAAKAALDGEQYQTAVDLLISLGDYRDSKELLTRAQTGARYQAALKSALSGKMAEAYSEFTALGDYGDSARKAEICGNLSRASRTQEITEGVLIFEFHQLWGVANLNTNVITAAKYTSITYDRSSQYSKHALLYVYLSGGSRWSQSHVNMNDSYGYIDFNGKEVIPCKYFAVTDFNAEGRCTVALVKAERYSSYGSSNNYYTRIYYGITDYTGKAVTAPQWRTMGVSTNSQWGNYDSAGNWKMSLFNVSQPTFTDGRMKVQNAEGKWGFISTQGKVLGQVKWASVGDFKDGMAMVCEAVSTGRYSTAQKYGFIDEQGRTVGEVRWDEVKDFSNGYAAVREGSYWGFINHSNELVIPCQYVEVAAFKPDGTCDVKTKNGTWQVINTSGEVSFF